MRGCPADKNSREVNFYYYFEKYLLRGVVKNNWQAAFFIQGTLYSYILDGNIQPGQRTVITYGNKQDRQSLFLFKPLILNDELVFL